MAKLTLTDLASTQANSIVTAVNNNNTLIEAAIENTLSRDGTSPNEMNADIDMNSNRVFNLPDATTDTEPVTLGQLSEAVGDISEGPEGPPGTPGADGVAPGIRFVFSTNTSDSDPGAGTFKFDNATFASITKIWIDNTNQSGTTVTSWLDALDDSTTTANRGRIRFDHITTPDLFNEFIITGAVVDKTGYREIPVSPSLSTTTFTNAQVLVANFSRTGDKGTDGAGAGDVVGPAASVDNEVVLFDSTTGKLIKRASSSGVAIVTSGVLSAKTNPLGAFVGDTDSQTLTNKIINLGSNTLNGTLANFNTAINDANIQPEDATLTALAAYNTNGLLTQTAADTFTGRTVTGSSSITAINGDGVAGNPTLRVTAIPIGIACSDETTALTTGTAKATFRMPYAFTLTAVRASLTTAQASGSIFTVDINEAGTTILSTKLTIDNTEKTSTTAATAAVISDSSLADDAEITIDIDQIGTSGATGLKVWLIGYPT